MADIISESARIRQSITRIVSEVIADKAKSCLRVYKAQVKTAPNGSTCEVQLIGDENTMTLPYSSECANVQKDSMVWVATLYDSFSNAIVWQPDNFNSMLSPYPVGAIYLSLDSTSPAQLFGGVWEQIKDRFLLTKGDIYTAGSTGGSADAVVVSHEGHLYGQGQWLGSGNASGKYLTNLSVYGTDFRGWNQAYGEEYYPAGHSEGEDGTGKNMPPYIVVYCWRRIS